MLLLLLPLATAFGSTTADFPPIQCDPKAAPPDVCIGGDVCPQCGSSLPAYAWGRRHLTLLQHYQSSAREISSARSTTSQCLCAW
jgi:hypothetical protein